MRMGRKCVANKDAHLRGGEQRTSFVERSQEAGLVSCLHYPARGGVARTISETGGPRRGFVCSVHLHCKRNERGGLI